MNLKFDSKQFTKKLGDYLVGTATALQDSTLQTQAQNYKRQLSNQMYPVEKLSITEKIPSLEGYTVSRKIDGEFCLLFFDGSNTISCNPGGTVRVGLPCFAEFSKLLKDAGVGEAVFACELFVKKKERERVHDVIRLARKPSDKKQLSSLAVYVFDIVSIEEKSLEKTVEVNKKIQDIFGKGVLVASIEFQITDSNRKILEIYEKWVETEGSEGLVVRHDGVGWFKIKPVHTIDCAIVGFSDSTNERKGMLHDLLVGLFRPDGSLQLLGKVGGGFSDDERRELFGKLKKSVVESDYVETSSAYLAYEWILPKVVAEIKCLDVIATNSRGDNINKMVLTWDKKNKKYLGMRKMPFVSILAPSFVRLRDDKSVNLEEVGIKQVSALVEIDDIEKKLAEIELPKSEMINRKVFYKRQGEKLMVRKILMWKTNKEHTNEYPAFITFYSDFSSQRKNALTTKMKPANDIKTAERSFEEFLEQLVKKGWEQYDGVFGK